jgi:hypothetical protein
MSYCGRLFVCSFAHVLVCSLARPLLKNRLISAMSSLALRTHYYEETFFGRRSVGYPCFWHSPMILQFIHSPLEARTQSQQMGDDMSKLNDGVKESGSLPVPMTKTSRKRCASLRLPWTFSQFTTFIETTHSFESQCKATSYYYVSQ